MPGEPAFQNLLLPHGQSVATPGWGTQHETGHQKKNTFSNQPLFHFPTRNLSMHFHRTCQAKGGAWSTHLYSSKRFTVHSYDSSLTGDHRALRTCRVESV